jgi:hypothetical protein
VSLQQEDIDMDALLGIGVALLPIGVVLALLGLVEWRDRRQERVVACQRELTEAIHRELGAVAAPLVELGSGGRWRVSMAVLSDRPDTVGALIRLTNRVLSRDGGSPGGRVRIAVSSEPVSWSSRGAAEMSEAATRSAMLETAALHAEDRSAHRKAA